MIKTVQIAKNRYEVHQKEVGSSAFINTSDLVSVIDKKVVYAGFSKDSLLSHLSELKPPESDTVFATGILGKAPLEIRLMGDSQVFLSTLFQDLIQIAESLNFDVEKPVGIELSAGKTELEYCYKHINGKGSGYDSSMESGFRAFGFGMRPPEHIPREDEHIRALIEFLVHHPAGGSCCLWMVAPVKHTSGFVNIQPEPETVLHHPEIKLWFPDRTSDAADFVRL